MPSFSCFKVTTHLRHAYFNSHDPRFWYRAALTWPIQTVLALVVLFTDAQSYLMPRIFLIIGLIFLFLQLPMAIVLGLESMKEREEAVHVFNRLDEDKDGYLTQEQALALIKAFHSNMFRKFSVKRNLFHIDDFTMVMENKRTHVGLGALEFFASIFIFFSTLMMFASGITALVVFQGVLAIFECWFLYHRAVWEYLSKYHATLVIFRKILEWNYWIWMLAVLVLFSSGYAVSVVTTEAFGYRYHRNTTNLFNITITTVSGRLIKGPFGEVPEREIPGLITGWILFGFALGVYIQFAICYWGLYWCRCLSIRKRKINDTISTETRAVSELYDADAWGQFKTVAQGKTQQIQEAVGSFSSKNPTVAIKEKVTKATRGLFMPWGGSAGNGFESWYGGKKSEIIKAEPTTAEVTTAESSKEDV